MKKIVFFFFFLTLSYRVFSQDIIIPNSLIILPDTVHIGGNYEFDFYITNTGDSAFSEVLHFEYYIDSLHKASAPNLHYSSGITVSVNYLDSLHFITNPLRPLQTKLVKASISDFGNNPKGFMKRGDNIVVIWPVYKNGMAGKPSYQRVYIEGPTGIETQSAGGEDLLIYPNPAFSDFSFNLPVEKVRIFNIFGAMVYETDAKENNISIEMLEDGFYLVHFYFKGHIYIRRLVKGN